jgi:hypothetical protein
MLSWEKLKTILKHNILKNNYNEAFIYNIYVQEINNIKNVKYITIAINDIFLILKINNDYDVIYDNREDNIDCIFLNKYIPMNKENDNTYSIYLDESSNEYEINEKIQNDDDNNTSNEIVKNSIYKLNDTLSKTPLSIFFVKNKYCFVSSSDNFEIWLCNKIRDNKIFLYCSLEEFINKPITYNNLKKIYENLSTIVRQQNKNYIKKINDLFTKLNKLKNKKDILLKDEINTFIKCNKSYYVMLNVLRIFET